MRKLPDAHMGFQAHEKFVHSREVSVSRAYPRTPGISGLAAGTGDREGGWAAAGRITIPEGG